MKRLLSIVAALVLSALWMSGCSKSSSTQSSSSATSGAGAGTLGSDADVARGKQLFTQNCATCHGADGTQGGIGPSLTNEKSRKDTAAAVAWIKNPRPPMPKLYPSPLNDKDVDALAAYVETL